MSKEIKFRAWIKSDKMMQPVHSIDFEQELIEYFGINDEPLTNVELMQFSGVIDCNGKDIYEGDILYFPEIDERTEVVFDEGAFRILFSFRNETEVLTNKIMDANYDVQVVGNIYENPELL